jgi:hypothetical protein
MQPPLQAKCCLALGKHTSFCKHTSSTPPLNPPTHSHPYTHTRTPAPTHSPTQTYTHKHIHTNISTQTYTHKHIHTLSAVISLTLVMLTTSWSNISSRSTVSFSSTGRNSVCGSKAWWLQRDGGRWESGGTAVSIVAQIVWHQVCYKCVWHQWSVTACTLLPCHHRCRCQASVCAEPPPQATCCKQASFYK